MTDRSNRPEVRNPVLGLEAFQRLQALPTEQREANAAIWYEIAAVSRKNADRSWDANKGPMALYWKWSGAWARHIARALNAAAIIPFRLSRQRRVAEWCAAAFGAEHATSLPQRGLRFLEEAVELYQACTINPETRQETSDQAARLMAHKLVDFVFDRPPGEVGQELGGVGVTVLALANAADLDADVCEAAEVERVLAKPFTYFAQRNAAKNAAGFDVTGAAYPSEAA